MTQLNFTKMQGAGNDFIVLDETAGAVGLTAGQYRWLADRHFGVGADQILTVRRPPVQAGADVDFEYLIHNADGGQVQQCGNGARCFARYVHDKGLTDKQALRLLTRAGIIEAQLQGDGRVRVNMGRPRLVPAEVPLEPAGLASEVRQHATLWQLPLDGMPAPWVVAVSMGNPHAVQVVQALAETPVEQLGRAIECHRAFPERVNAGFMQVLSPRHIALRVFERGAGETLACGTGACAAVVAGILQGLLEHRVDVDTRGGLLTIEWAEGCRDDVLMTGPAVTVFEGRIELPHL